MGSGAKMADSDASLLPKKVGARLRQLRQQAGLTQSEVAVRMCRPGQSGKSYVCQIERGFVDAYTSQHNGTTPAIINMTFSLRHHPVTLSLLLHSRASMILDSVCLRNYAFSPPMATSHSSAELLEQVEALSGQTISDCYQCGCCTAGCPIGETMDPPPSKAIRLLQLGKASELLDSDGIWLCASCLVCGTRCPRAVDYARIAEACRALILRSKQSRVDPDTATAPELEEIPQQAFIAAFRKSSV